LSINTTLTTVAIDATGNLVITDTASGGKADSLTVSLNGTNIRIHDPNNNISAGAGTTQVDATTVDTPLASVVGPKGILVNANGGNDQLTLDFTNGNPIPVHGLLFNGGAGTDTLLGNFADNIWNITGANAGNIDGLKVAFTGVESLTGNTARDVFRFIGSSAALGGKIDGGGAPNWLDYTSATTAVSVNLATGAASRIKGGAANINNVIGSAVGGSKLVGNSAGNVLLGKGGGNTIIGGSGRSFLVGGFGVNKITGGAADDLIINGRTVLEKNYASLEIVLGIWQNTTMTYAQRINYLQTSPNTPLVIGSTVFVAPGQSAGGLGPRLGTGNFVYQSSIHGGGGSDWYLTNLTLTVLDRAPGEVITLPV
jgi:hypothetical protein